MERARVAILISGSGTNMVSLVESMTAAHPGQAVGVISNKPDAAGLARAEALGLPAIAVPHKGCSKETFEAALHEALLELRPDVICLAGFMRILSADFVNKWPGKILNIHPSLLPLFKGLNTHAQVLEAGMAIHGASVHVVTPQLDDGSIIGQTAIPVLPEDTPDMLAARLLPKEHALYVAALRAFITQTPLPIAHL